MRERSSLGGTPVPNCRRCFILLVIASTLGTFCAVVGAKDLCAAFTIVIFLPLLIFVLFKKRVQYLLPVALSLVAPAASYFLTTTRCELAPHSILKSKTGQSAILELRLDKEISRRSGNGSAMVSTTYQAKALRMYFPNNKELNETTLLVLSPSKTNLTLPAEGETVIANVRIQALDESPARAVDWNAQSSIRGRRLGCVCLGTLRDSINEYQIGSKAAPIDNKDKALEYFRSKLLQAHVHVLGDDLGSLLSSMVIGDKAVKLPAALVDDFRKIGLSHILAASGFNLTIVTAFIFFVGRLAFKSESTAALWAIAGMLIYVTLAGGSPSIMRAAIMSGILVISRISKRSVSTISALCGSLLITELLDPLSLTDIGLQLSYAATIGIICSASKLSALCQIGTSRIAASSASLAGTCLAAQFAVLPIQVFFFHTANILFLPANFLVLPLVAPITVAGFLSSFLSLSSAAVPPLAAIIMEPGVRLLDSLLRLPLEYIRVVTKCLASCDWAQIYTGQPQLWSLCSYYAFWILLLVALKNNARLATLGMLLGLALLALFASGSQSCLPFVQTSTPTLVVANFRQGYVLTDRSQEAVGMFPAGAPILKRYLTQKGVHRLSTVADLPTSSSGIQTTPDVLADSTLETRHEDLCSWISIAIGRQHWRARRYSPEIVAYLNKASTADEVGVLVLPSADSISEAPTLAGQFLAFFHCAAEKFLLVRLDTARPMVSHTVKQNPSKVLADIATVLNSCAIGNAILVMSEKEYQYMADALAKCPSASLQRQSISLECERKLIAVSFTREQLNKYPKAR